MAHFLSSESFFTDPSSTLALVPPYPQERIRYGKELLIAKKKAEDEERKR